MTKISRRDRAYALLGLFDMQTRNTDGEMIIDDSTGQSTCVGSALDSWIEGFFAGGFTDETMLIQEADSDSGWETEEVEADWEEGSIKTKQDTVDGHVLGRGLEETSPSPIQSRRPTPKHKFEGHKEWIMSFFFLHDNVHIVSGSWDGTMRKWDCDTGLLVGDPWKGEGGSIHALALSPDGKTIACGRDNGSVQRWDTYGEMMEGVCTGHSKGVRSLSWSPSGGHVSSGSYDGTILVRKAESGEVTVGPIKTKQDWVRSLAYSPSGDRIASGGKNATVCIWDSKTGKPHVSPIKTQGLVTSLVWSSDSSKLYSASNKFTCVLDSVSGIELHRFEHAQYLDALALSPKHNVLACVGDGGVAQLWDTESHEPLGLPFSQEYDKRLYCVSFSRDGRYLAHGGDNNKITLWMVENIAPELPVCAFITILQGDKLHSRKLDVSPHQRLA
ncbi:WD40 repeat-like protein [Rhizopogon vinicolor AM-OR11-026]|uniref:WD40 repeat-like protein n=1 Tax=Rhizopogon vinicolor AM-OR11-026 TaxID=1314800 RepID=A0A1B7NHV8_9AGAM|nr:WD40 repeat-like protein [Rhizopogon vinicolor AM-OR11-026]